MALYPYVATLAVDPVTLVKAAGATGVIYAPADTSFAAPLTATDATGNPIPLTSNSDGILPSFYATAPAVNWRSGEYVFPLVTSQPLPGPQGDRGDDGVDGAKGADGANVLPTETAVDQARDVVKADAVRDGVTNTLSALQAADSAAGAAGKALVLRTGVHRVTGSVTINSQVVVQPGAILKPSNGTVITVKGAVQAANRQFIDMSLGGVVVLENVPTFYPEWWGPTGTADDSETWRKMLVSASYLTTYQSVTPRSGINRIWQLDLTNVHIEGKGRTRRFLPPTTATAGNPLTGTGYMIKLYGTTTIDGGVWETGGIPGITIMFWTGHRCWVKNAHIRVPGANTVGVWAYVLGGSITPKIMNTFVEGDLNEPSGVGIRYNSPDGELTNVTIAYCSTGLELLRGSTVLNAVHIWDSLLYGVYMNGADLTRFVACYIETNRSWGIYAEGCNYISIDEGTYIWKNGNGVAGTGGMILRGVGGSISDDNMINGVWNDNYGTGLKLESADRTRGTLHFISTTNRAAVAAGATANAAITTTGVLVDNTSVGTDIKVISSDSATAAKPFFSPVTGKIVDNFNGQHTQVSLGDRKVRNTALVTVGSNAGAYTNGFFNATSILMGIGHVVEIEATLIVEAPTTSDLRIRMRATSAVGMTGWYAITTASDPTTPTSIVPSTVRDLVADGSTNVAIGGTGAKQLVTVRGYASMGTAYANLELQVALNATPVDDTQLGKVHYSELKVTRVL